MNFFEVMNYCDIFNSYKSGRNFTSKNYTWFSLTLRFNIFMYWKSDFIDDWQKLTQMSEFVNEWPFLLLKIRQNTYQCPKYTWLSLSIRIINIFCRSQSEKNITAKITWFSSSLWISIYHSKSKNNTWVPKLNLNLFEHRLSILSATLRQTENIRMLYVNWILYELKN